MVHPNPHTHVPDQPEQQSGAEHADAALRDAVRARGVEGECELSESDGDGVQRRGGEAGGGVGEECCPVGDVGRGGGDGDVFG